MGINNLLNFYFMDPPNPATLMAAVQQLCNQGALNEKQNTKNNKCGILVHEIYKIIHFSL